ncbi:MAG: hypothetical protein HC892_19470 [Saprospiraceae bacterium]|nr:hypothetical protein [Saprospiraceae bacterium]
MLTSFGNSLVQDFNLLDFLHLSRIIFTFVKMDAHFGHTQSIVAYQHSVHAAVVGYFSNPNLEPK